MSPFMGLQGSNVPLSSGHILKPLGQAGGWRPACTLLQARAWRWHIVQINALFLSG